MTGVNNFLFIILTASQGAKSGQAVVRSPFPSNASVIDSLSPEANAASGFEFGVWAIGYPLVCFQPPVSSQLLKGEIVESESMQMSPEFKVLFITVTCTRKS